MGKGAVALIIFGIIGFGGIYIMFNSQKTGQKQPTAIQEIPGPTGQVQGNVTSQPQPVPTQLEALDVKIGEGKEASAGATVSVHYTGALINGQKFDSSRDKGQPFSFQLGLGQVIQGWDMGVQGMKVGGIRKLLIPANLAYGEQGRPPVIPPNSPLIFEIELLDVQ